METGHVSNPRVTLAIRDGLSACGFPGSPAPWDRPADKDDPHPSLLVGGKGEICRVGFQKRRADRRNRAFLGGLNQPTRHESVPLDLRAPLPVARELERQAFRWLGKGDHHHGRRSLWRANRRNMRLLQDWVQRVDSPGMRY